MSAGRITKRAVDAFVCPVGADRGFMWDIDLVGFGVVAHPSGKKTYVIQFRSNGRSRRVTLGQHGRITPEEARSLAKQMLGMVESGHDPVAQRKAARAVPTFREIAEDFMALHVRPKRKARTGEEYDRLLRLHILPAIGSRRVVDVTRGDVARLHAQLSRESPFAANRCVALVSALWNWAANRDLVSRDTNPARGLEKNRESGRERFLSATELGRLADALHDAETIGLPYEVDAGSSKHAPKPGTRYKIDPFALAAIRLLLLTGARLREILHARWADVDLDRGMIFLPDSKTGRKPVYLSAAAIDVLASLSRVGDNPYVIPGEAAGSPRADLNRPWRAVRKAAGLEDVRLHDLRHTFASFAAGASLGLPLIGRLLGHTQPATTARYAHLDADPLRRAADRIGADITAAMSGQRHRPNFRVVK